LSCKIRRAYNTSFPPSGQQTPADLGFELGNLLADGGLRTADAFSGARNTHGVGNDQKRAKAIDIEIHLPLHYRQMRYRSSLLFILPLPEQPVKKNGQLCARAQPLAKPPQCGTKLPKSGRSMARNRTSLEAAHASVKQLIALNYLLSWVLAIVYGRIAAAKFDPLAAKAAMEISSAEQLR
jgi:hypothetical protein